MTSSVAARRRVHEAVNYTTWVRVVWKILILMHRCRIRWPFFCVIRSSMMQARGRRASSASSIPRFTDAEGDYEFHFDYASVKSNDLILRSAKMPVSVPNRLGYQDLMMRFTV